MEMSMAFSNLEQSMAEDCAAVTNLLTANSPLTGQVSLYANRLSIKVQTTWRCRLSWGTYRAKLKI